MKKKRILFVCKHNLFRSQVAKIFFNRLNKNKKYVVDSAGLIKFNKKDLKGDDDVTYKIEKKILKEQGINLKGNSKGLSGSMLKRTDILIIVADDVPPSIFKKTGYFKGKIIIWKAKDTKPKDKRNEKIALNSVKFIEKKVKELVKKL